MSTSSPPPWTRACPPAAPFALRKARLPNTAVEKSNKAVGRYVGSTMHLRDEFPLRSSCWAAPLVMLVAGACHRGLPPAPPAPAAAASPAASGDAPRLPVRAPGSFADNPIVYFVMTDRFVNGDPGNDHSYGRSREPEAKDDIATFHGGDLRGLTGKVNDGWFDAARRQRAVDHRAVRADPRLGGRRRQAVQALRLPRLLRARLHAARSEHGHARRPARAGRRRPWPRHPDPVRRGDEPPRLPRHHHGPAAPHPGDVAGRREGDARRLPHVHRLQ